MVRFQVVRFLILSLVLTGAPSLAAQDSPAAAAPAARATAAVNLNTATLSELATLPGIGAKTAQLIVEHREKTGGFKKVEELMHVKGIGEKSFLKLKELVTVGDGKMAQQQ